MLWTLLKILIFIVLVAVLAVGAGLVLDTGTGLRLAFGGWEFTLGPLQAVIAAGLVLLALWLALKLLGLIAATFHFLNGDDTAISRYFDESRQRRGYEAVSQSLIALASGEGRLALNTALKAEKLLDRPEVTSLLVAQAAEAAGETQRAGEAWKSLLAHDETRFVAIRGLLRQKLAEGDTDTALKLAEKAFDLRPRHGETQDILLKLQSGHADWSGARATLNAQARTGALPRDVWKRRDAILALQEAKTVLDEDASPEAREAAIAANKASPDLIPAAAMAARSLTGKGDKKTATRVLKKAWESQPHPDLAAAFAAIEPGETPAARLSRFKTLTASNQGAAESRLLMAELNIAAEDFPAARRALGDLPTTHPTQRTLAIMAAVERGEGSDDAVVRGWLAKALTAPRGPQWCCDQCHAVHSDWSPICPNCNGFDTLSWREPTQTTGASATGSEFLPLLVTAKTAQDPEPPPAVVPHEPEPIDLEAIARRAN
jgi:HemY protein